MKFYAFIPGLDNKEPIGTSNRTLFELKSRSGAIRRAERTLGPKVRLYTYTNFYDNETFTEIFIRSRVT